MPDKPQPSGRWHTAIGKFDASPDIHGTWLFLPPNYLSASEEKVRTNLYEFVLQHIAEESEDYDFWALVEGRVKVAVTNEQVVAYVRRVQAERAALLEKGAGAEVHFRPAPALLMPDKPQSYGRWHTAIGKYDASPDIHGTWHFIDGNCFAGTDEEVRTNLYEFVLQQIAKESEDYDFWALVEGRVKVVVTYEEVAGYARKVEADRAANKAVVLGRGVAFEMRSGLVPAVGP